MKNLELEPSQKRMKPSFSYSYPKDNDSTPFLESFDLKKVKTLGESRFQVHIVYCNYSQTYYAMKLYPYLKGQLHPFFRSENRFTRELQHPNVIQIIDSGKKQKAISQNSKLIRKSSYILLKLASYGDLFTPLKQGQIPRNLILARTFFQQLINGLEYLHQKGISHMDLKLSNILIGENFNLKIADFDSSYKQGDIMILGKGTTNYRAYEIIKGTCKDTKAADIFSMGIILYLLVMQCFPFVEDPDVDGGVTYEFFLSDTEEFWEIAEKLPHVPNIEQDFKELFQIMVREEPTERITIQEIKRSKWYNRVVYTKKQLSEILESKLQQIDLSPEIKLASRNTY